MATSRKKDEYIESKSVMKSCNFSKDKTDSLIRSVD